MYVCARGICMGDCHNVPILYWSARVLCRRRAAARSLWVVVVAAAEMLGLPTGVLAALVRHTRRVPCVAWLTTACARLVPPA